MKKTIKITILICLILFAFSNVKVHAVLQSNGDAGTTYNLSDWMMNIRKMETLGGGMGLEETVNSDLTGTTSNKIDVHMKKNTEYGALAILSASSYGNPNKITDGQTTTGNASGVVMKINSEWVAAGGASYATYFNNAKARYKNIYQQNYVAKNGDAITETYGWHGSSDNSWGAFDYSNGAANSGIYNTYNGLVRSHNGSIFSYNSYSIRYGGGGWYRSSAIWSNAYRSRAAIVQGDGI